MISRTELGFSIAAWVTHKLENCTLYPYSFSHSVIQNLHGMIQNPLFFLALFNMTTYNNVCIHCCCSHSHHCSPAFCPPSFVFTPHLCPCPCLYPSPPPPQLACSCVYTYLAALIPTQLCSSLRFAMGILKVGFSHTIPKPPDTTPV